jgi:2,3-bisphosphoglycerate-dependent phosphoglycerate mutase
MAKLILIRHGKSAWNKLGLWTGWVDIDLAEEGIEEARRAGQALLDIEIHKAHVADMKRTKQTLKNVLEAADKKDIETEIHSALNERSYGIYEGKNKWEVKELIGEEEFQKIRRGWNTPIPKGETLKDVHARVVPYFDEHILPDLKSGMNVLVSSCGNALRALVKHLEQLDEEGVANLEFGTGEVYIYDVDSTGKILGKEIRSANVNKGKV